MAAQEVNYSLPASFGTRPWLIQATRSNTLTLVDPVDQSLHETVIPEIEGKMCLGCVHGGDWLFMLDESTHECFLLSLTAVGPWRRRNKIWLPPLHEPLDFLGICAVLESPEHPDFTVLFSTTPEAGDHFLLHCRPGDQEWTWLISPLDGLTFSTLIVNCNGSVYALAWNNLMLIDLVDGVVRTRLIGFTELDKAIRRVCGYYPNIVESDGDLFFVWILEHGFDGNDGVFGDIIVDRLDLSDPESMVWRTVDGIGNDRAFLLSPAGYGFSCAAREGQMEGNCVYLIWQCCDGERLYKFCLDDMTSSFRRFLSEPSQYWSRPFWITPANIQARDTEDVHSVSSPSCSPLWHDLPLELLELVVANLSLVDRLRFPAVCKSWSKVFNPVEQAKVWPWLMHCSKQDGICKMFDPLRGKKYTLRIEAFATDIERHIFRSSKDGWVVVSGGSDEIFVINPFTGHLVEDPPMFDEQYNYYGISFSSMPVSPDCLFFGITSSHSGDIVSVHTWKHGEDRWSQHEFEHQVSPFPVACNNPVLFRGKFYCLGMRGNLGVFDPGSEDPKSAWKILDKPEPIHADMDLFYHDHHGREFCYLVELNGELVSVFMRNAPEPPRVFKLDGTKMAWIEVEDIGGAALFLDIRASYAVASPEGGHGNKIFLPLFSEDGQQGILTSSFLLEQSTYCPEVMESYNCSPLPSGFGTGPWLIQVDGRRKQQTVTIVDSLDRSLHEVAIPETQDKVCLGCVHNGEWLVILDELSGDCFLLRLRDSHKVPLPPFHELLEFVGRCALLGSPMTPSCTVVIASKPDSDQNFLVYCRPGDEVWTKLAAATAAAAGTIYGYITCCAGKLYAAGSRKIVVVDVIDGEICTELIGACRREAFYQSCKCYLVDSYGVLFNVQVEYFGRPDQGVLVEIAVHRLDYCSDNGEGPVWRRVERIGDNRVFLLAGDYGFSCPAGEDKTSVTEQANFSAPWHNLPLELLEVIVSNLPLVDRLRFPAVCKSWSMVSSPVEQARVWPWLMHVSKQDGTCKMFDPLRGEEYTLPVAALESDDRNILRSSKDGWVVVSTGDEADDIFIMNPFREDTILPPMFDRCYHFHGVSFSLAPTSPDCVVFGVNSSRSGVFFSIETWQTGEEDWQEIWLEQEVPFPVAHNNPVYFRGDFYCLGRKGNIGIFDPKDRKWRVLDKPEPIHAELDVSKEDHEGAEFCYLVELQGKLIAVFQRNADEPPRVFKLDETETAWVEVEDIGGAALFLDYRASFAVASPEAGHGNKIYFPRYSEDARHAAFYDLENKSYSPSYYGLKSPANCVWVVPNLRLD
ncbi:unnamed protein product [Urochloa decumbens]|uniref:F-box domain-containing protein n=1 Tax=Urochloa decumbens TaxID=240449 RepID=A0ABC9BGT3_9POAL